MVMFRSAHARRAFTAVEMLIVIGIAVTLVSLSIPAILQAQHRARVTGSADAIVQVGSAARLRALTEITEPGKRYGVRVVLDQSSGQGSATLTYGPDTNAGSTKLIDGDTKPLMQIAFARNLLLKRDGALIWTVGWMYEPHTGLVVDAATDGAALIDVTGLVLSSADERVQAALAVYRCGLVHQESL